MLTDAFGSYRFTLMVAGVSYYIDVEEPTGYDFVAQDVGGSTLVDSDVNQSTDVRQALS